MKTFLGFLCIMLALVSVLGLAFLGHYENNIEHPWAFVLWDIVFFSFLIVAHRFWLEHP